ncbi:FAD dependent oxidoreductase [Mytilinidion resinicola]|uniref:FAD dependent oxidoreductase n=1 Tax=Mytilinidion resinicola TaxID=574789 RepID=A0A6A6YSH8_9PEZI|nr:FAD dependent oxidoreductase [Mytilinidion resinicola]KAF2810867.1 FAD dependent oxidoreductase [Mytilinidion resinicola]
MASQTERKNIVIIGGGIIGSTTAYFLSHHPKFNPATHTITLLEATKIAGGASGKAGGLLALWAYPSCIVPLSYRLHEELADKHGGAERWGYRAVYCGQLDAKARPNTNSSAKTKDKESVSLKKRSQKAFDLLKSAGIPKDLDWVDPESVRAYDSMGDPSTTAQVHPYQFTTSMAELAGEKGVEIIYGSAKKIDLTADDSAVTSVTYAAKEDGSTRTLPADTVILTAGPWSSTVWPETPIESVRAHSVTIRPSRPVSAYALFTSITLDKQRTVSPEIYARPNNEVYACGPGDMTVPLPPSTDVVEIDDARCKDVVDQVSAISDELRDGEVTARQACYLPHVTSGDGPLIGETSVKGLLIGTGHTCWGIQNAPGTGCALAELVWEGEVRSANLKSLDPKLHM